MLCISGTPDTVGALDKSTELPTNVVGIIELEKKNVSYFI